ncbi:MAG TPA: hypothetical protein VD995_02975 [Azospirillum sp.]|nr:hypothetical protein [Azospirillum sp.]
MTKGKLWATVLAAVILAALGAAPAEARCIDNQSSARVKVDIHFLWINRIQQVVWPGENRCFTYNFLASLRLDATSTDVKGAVAKGFADYPVTTNLTRVRVFDERVYESNGVKYYELGFCRDC